MGWQGRFRDAKGRRLYAKLPVHVREGTTFIRVSAWRDDRSAYVLLRRGNCVEQWHVDRQTGAPVADRDRSLLVFTDAQAAHVLGRLEGLVHA